MHPRTSLATSDSAGAAARILGAVRRGTIAEIEQELGLASLVCGEQLLGDSLEAERRELLDSVVSRFQRALVRGEALDMNSRSLSACLALLEHLGGAYTAHPAKSYLQPGKLLFSNAYPPPSVQSLRVQ